MAEARTRPTLADWLDASYARRHEPVRPDSVEEVRARLAAAGSVAPVPSVLMESPGPLSGTVRTGSDTAPS